MCNITKEKLYNIIRDNRIMDDAGTTFVVLNENLQVLYVNYTSVEESLGLNPGDLLKCSNAMEAEHGCGTHENCKLCKLRNMVESSISTRSKMESDVELLVSENADFSFHAISTPFIYGLNGYVPWQGLSKYQRHTVEEERNIPYSPQLIPESFEL